MRAVALREVVKEFPQTHVRAVDGVSFDVEHGELLVLLGPSGCGKTTTLRMIAGLEEPDHGEVWLEDRRVSSAERNQFVPTEKRNIGMVFQSYAIWPHMSVFDNVAYPLRVRDVRRVEEQERVGRALELVGLQGLERRPATDLSGGQQQRVALARAIVFEPRLLLLDEPLSNLDAQLRIHMRAELKHLQQQTGFTTIFVTHDQAESMALADRIIVMNRGRIEQIGTPVEIYERPATQFVSEFVGSVNAFTAEVVEVSRDGSEKMAIVLRRGAQWIRGRLGADTPIRSGQQMVVSIRPEKLSLHADRVVDGQSNVWQGQIAAAAYYGDHREYEVRVDGQSLKVTTMAGTVFDTGSDVFVACDPGEVLLMSPASARR